MHRSVTDTECEDLTCGHVSNDNDGSLLKPEIVCFRFWSCFVVTMVATAHEIRLSAVGIIYNYRYCVACIMRIKTSLDWSQPIQHEATH